MIEQPVQMTPQEEQAMAQKAIPLQTTSYQGQSGIVHHGVTPGGLPIEGVRTGFMPEHQVIAGRPHNAKYLNRISSIYRRLKATGVPVSTVLNFLPYQLAVNSPMTSLKKVIPAAPLPGMGKDEFSFHTFENIDIIAIDEGEDELSPWELVPRQLADTYQQEYLHCGGVVVIDSYPTSEALELPEVQEAIATAKEKMIQYLHRMVNEGMAEWMKNNESGRKNVDERHHIAGRYLHAAGFIEELPAYMLKVRTASDVQKKCTVCGKVPDVGMSICGCGYVLDPAAAYRAGAIDEEHVSLERLTREQVEELGISAYVAETADEKPERLRQGLPKPMSQARYQLEAAAEQQQPQQRGAKEQHPAL